MIHRRFLAVGLLLAGALPFASADFVIIKVNLAAVREAEDESQGGLAGGMPGMPGMPGGMPGMPGGMGGLRGGGRGGLPGAPGGIGQGQMMGRNLPGGPGGGRGAGAGGSGRLGTGGDDAGGGAFGSRRGAGGAAGGGQGGKFGGQAGPGGMAQGRPGQGGLPGMGGFFTSNTSFEEEEDSSPLIVGCVVETDHRVTLKVNVPTRIRHKWGETDIFLGPDTEIQVISKAIPPVAKSFLEKRKLIKEDDPNKAESLLNLARWGLERGLLDQVSKVMEDLAKVDPKHDAVVAYQKIQAQLQKPVTTDDPSFAWKEKLGELKVERSPHYTLIYATSLPEAQNRLKRLERSFQGFFYWFALHGKVLPVPGHRLTVVLDATKEAFEHHNKSIFDDARVQEEGFYSRRENLAFMCSIPLDMGYEALEADIRAKDYHTTWIPEELFRRDVPNRKRLHPNELARARTYILISKAMQLEAEQAASSFEGSRQLLSSSGLVPRNVRVPRWVDFGLGSFFETSKGSYWAGTGGPNVAYLSNCKKWVLNKSKRLERDPSQALRAVVTDRYYREADDTKSQAEMTRARTMSWALSYFIANRRLDGFFRYYDELRTLPRDVEFDDDVLLLVFAKAFGLLDNQGTVDANRFANFANEWYQFIRIVPDEMDQVWMDSSSFVDAYNKLEKQRQQQRPGFGLPGGGAGGGTGGFGSQ